MVGRAPDGVAVLEPGGRGRRAVLCDEVGEEVLVAVGRVRVGRRRCGRGRARRRGRRARRAHHAESELCARVGRGAGGSVRGSSLFEHDRGREHNEHNEHNEHSSATRATRDKRATERRPLTSSRSRGLGNGDGEAAAGGLLSLSSRRPAWPGRMQRRRPLVCPPLPFVELSLRRRCSFELIT